MLAAIPQMNGSLCDLLGNETLKAIASDVVAEPEKLVPRRLI